MATYGEPVAICMSIVEWRLLYSEVRFLVWYVITVIIHGVYVQIICFLARKKRICKTAHAKAG